MKIQNSSNNNRTRSSAGSVLGNFYNRIAGIGGGLNLKNQFKNFTSDFKKSAGIKGPLFDKTYGLQPTLFSERLPDTTRSFTYNSVNDSANLRDFLAGLNENAKINIEGLPKGMDIPTFLDKVANDKSLLKGRNARGNLASPITINSTTPGDIVEGTGIKLGTLANIGSGIYQGVNTIKNINDTIDTNDTYDDIVRAIKKSAFANPMHSSYLTADQRDMLFRLNNGSYDSPNIGDILTGVGKSIPQALLAAAGGFASGGTIGAAINGLGSLASGGFQGWNNASQDKQSELQGLYQTLLDAEQDYNNMRRPTNLRSSGLQRRYSNSLY